MRCRSICATVFIVAFVSTSFFVAQQSSGEPRKTSSSVLFFQRLWQRLENATSSWAISGFISRFNQTSNSEPPVASPYEPEVLEEDDTHNGTVNGNLLDCHLCRRDRAIGEAVAGAEVSSVPPCCTVPPESVRYLRKFTDPLVPHSRLAQVALIHVMLDESDFGMKSSVLEKFVTAGLWSTSESSGTFAQQRKGEHGGASISWDDAVLEIRNNQTFVALPFLLHRCALLMTECDVDAFEKSAFTAANTAAQQSPPSPRIATDRRPTFPRGQPREEFVQVIVRLTREGLLDPRAFVLTNASVLQSRCAALRREAVERHSQPTLRFSTRTLAQQIPTNFSDSIDCTEAADNANKARIAIHTTLYAPERAGMESKFSYLRAMLNNFAQYPLAVDWYIHVHANETLWGPPDGSLKPEDSTQSRAEHQSESERVSSNAILMAKELVSHGVVVGVGSTPPEATKVATLLPGVREVNVDSQQWLSSDAHRLLYTCEAVSAFVLQEGLPPSFRNRQYPKRRKVRVMVVPHVLEDGVAPFFLQWKPRELIKSQRALYDLVLYGEDDLDITRGNLEYYCAFKDEARRQGYYLSFFRVEYRVERPRLRPNGPVTPGTTIRTAIRAKSRTQLFQTVRILSDVFRFQNVSQASLPITINGQLFARVEIQVYHGFWLADRRDLNALIADPRFIRRNVSMQPLIMEDAACLQGSMMLPHYRGGRIVPVDNATSMLHPMSLVWHMSNAYVRKGMARFDSSGKVYFANETRAGN